jgi:hypothetical protein
MTVARRAAESMNGITKLLLFSFASLCFAACAPATTYNRGIEISYHPSAKADGEAKVVDSATELQSEAEEQALRASGAKYLGELEVVGEKAGAMFTGSGQGASTLSGRISIEAANRGATHFRAASSRTENGVEAQGKTLVPTSKTHVRYVLYRAMTSTS